MRKRGSSRIRRGIAVIASTSRTNYRRFKKESLSLAPLKKGSASHARRASARQLGLISDHASLARLGYSVDVFTRRDSANLPQIVEWRPRVRDQDVARVIVAA